MLGLTATIGGSCDKDQSEKRVWDLLLSLNKAKILTEADLTDASKRDLQACKATIDEKVELVKMSMVEEWFAESCDKLVGVMKIQVIHACICMYVCVCVSTYVCIYIYMYIYIYIYMHRRIIAYMHAYMHTCKHIMRHVCIYIYTYTCVNIQEYTQVYIHTYIHTYIHKRLIYRSNSEKKVVRSLSCDEFELYMDSEVHTYRWNGAKTRVQSLSCDEFEFIYGF